MSYPRPCPNCEITLHTDAELFVHESIHAVPPLGPGFVTPPMGSLPLLHFAFVPAVARLCEEYARRMPSASPSPAAANDA